MATGVIGLSTGVSTAALFAVDSHLMSWQWPAEIAPTPSPPTVDYSLIHSNRDPYYRLAKQHGYRARSAYKLINVNSAAKIVSPDTTNSVIDLCCAPGSWSQAIRHLCPRAAVIGVDLQECAPVNGVTMIQADITALDTLMPTLKSHLSRAKATSSASSSSSSDAALADCVISDGAPDVTGQHSLDEYVHSQLLYATMTIALHILKPQTGHFVAKVFRADCTDLLMSQIECIFDDVALLKPMASRPQSAEHFVVAKRLILPKHYQISTNSNENLQSNTDDNRHSCAHCHTVVRSIVNDYLYCGSLSAHHNITSSACCAPSSLSATMTKASATVETQKHPSYMRFLRPVSNTT